MAAMNFDENQLDIHDTQSFRPKRRLEDTEMDITPMIDITFLLLIFFVVAAKMDQPPPITMPVAKHGTAVTVRDAVVLTVSGKAAEVRVFKGDSTDSANSIDTSDPASLEADIQAFVEDETALYPNKTWVIIKGAGDVEHGSIERVSKAAARAAAIQNLAIGVMEVQ